MRIRLLAGSKSATKVIGHWFLRPVEGVRGHWKLSFWHPEYNWKDRRCEQGTDYEQALYVFASTFYEIAQQKHTEYLQAKRKVDALVAQEEQGGGVVNSGFRKGFAKRTRGQLTAAWFKWRDHFIDKAESYMSFAAECGWPRVPFPTWPWESE